VHLRGLQFGYRGHRRGGQTPQIEIRLRRHDDSCPLESVDGGHAVLVYLWRSRRERQVFRERCGEAQDGRSTVIILGTSGSRNYVSSILYIL